MASELHCFIHSWLENIPSSLQAGPSSPAIRLSGSAAALPGLAPRSTYYSTLLDPSGLSEPRHIEDLIPDPGLPQRHLSNTAQKRRCEFEQDEPLPQKRARHALGELSNNANNVSSSSRKVSAQDLLQKMAQSQPAAAEEDENNSMLWDDQRTPRAPAISLPGRGGQIPHDDSSSRRSGSPQKRSRRMFEIDEDCSNTERQIVGYSVQATTTQPHIQYPHPSSRDSGLRSEASSATSAKSKRSNSPSKATLPLLERQAKGITFASLSGSDNLSPDIKPLMANLISELIIPSPIFDTVKDLTGWLEPVRPHMRVDSSLSLADLEAEFGLVKEICSRAAERLSEGLNEADWNESVNRPILRHVFESHDGKSSLQPYNVTTVKMLPRLLADPASESLPNKVVDYVLASTRFTGDSHNDNLVKSALARQVAAACGSGDTLNHFTYQPTWNKPAVVSIEVKTPQNSEAEANIQVAVWAAGQFSRLRQLTGWASDIPMTLMLPLIVVYGSTWNLMLARDFGSHIKIYRIPSLAFGKSDSIIGCYRLIVNLRHLATWADAIFHPWYEKHVLSNREQPP